MKHSNYHSYFFLKHVEDFVVSSYDSKTLLECFCRVDQHERTCKDKAGVSKGLSVAAIGLQFPPSDLDIPCTYSMKNLH